MQSVKIQWLLYILYIMFISADPFAAFSGFDKGHRIIFFTEIATLTYCYNAINSFRKVFRYELNIIWFILIIYHWINCIMHDVPSEHGYFLLLYPIFSSFTILVLSCYLYLQNAMKASIVFSIGLLSYVMFAVLSGNYIEDASGAVRLTGSIHMNQLGQAGGFCLFMLLILKQHIKKQALMKFILLSIIPLYGIIQAGSRNAFIMLVFASFTLLFSKTLSSKISIGKIFRLLILGIISYLLFNFLLENTAAGQRLLGTSEQAEMQNTMYQTGTFLDFLGDRGWYYYVGFQNFIENPLFGIGMWNFAHYNNAIFPLHTEYMVHITEGGIIASSLYFYFIFRIGKGLVQINSKERSELSVILGLCFITYLIVCFTARAFYYIQFYVVMGITIAEIMKFEVMKKS